MCVYIIHFLALHFLIKKMLLYLCEGYIKKKNVTYDSQIILLKTNMKIEYLATLFSLF